MTCPSTRVFPGDAFIHEIWTWFGIGTLSSLLRLALRFHSPGFRNFQGDDYFAVVVWICYFGKSVALTFVFLYGSNIDYAGDSLVLLEQCQIDRVEMGSRMEFLAWYTYCGIIWGLKAMVLFILHRLTFSLAHPRIFRLISILTSLTAIAMFLTLTLACLPFYRNWQVSPAPPAQCSLRMHDVYVSTALNIATDVAILAVPVPQLWSMKIPRARKIGIVLLICSGIYMMLAASLRLGFTLGGRASEVLNLWCQRETTVGIIAVNMPVLWSYCNQRWNHPRGRVDDCRRKRRDMVQYPCDAGLPGDKFDAAETGTISLNQQDSEPATLVASAMVASCSSKQHPPSSHLSIEQPPVPQSIMS